MALNIKDVETTALIRELADTTGETLTAATRIAVSERLDRVRSDRSGEDQASALLRIGQDVADRLAALGASLDTDDLYGADGMPR